MKGEIASAMQGKCMVCTSMMDVTKICGRKLYFDVIAMMMARMIVFDSTMMVLWTTIKRNISEVPAAAL